MQVNISEAATEKIKFKEKINWNDQYGKYECKRSKVKSNV
jgi:hypothetical protein